MKAMENRERGSAGQQQGAAMNKGKTESHAETRSSRRESNPPTSALSAAPREKNLETGLGNGVGERFPILDAPVPFAQNSEKGSAA